MDQKIVQRIPGAAELIHWFGRFPSFHDAKLLRFVLDAEGGGEIDLSAFQMTDRVDERGYYVHEKHFDCTIRFGGAESVQLAEFQRGEGVVFKLSIESDNDAFIIHLESSYGIEGLIKARSIAIAFRPLHTV